MNEDNIAQPTKLETILAVLLLRSLNMFEAETIGDHTLRSTISRLSNHYGLLFERTREKVPNRFGGQTPVVRYRLPKSEHEKAKSVLEQLKARCR